MCPRRPAKGLSLAHLVIFQPDARAEARLADALTPGHTVSVVRAWAELRRFVADVGADGCLVDADSPSREDALMEIRRLRREYPDLALVAYADVHESDPELVSLGAAGVDGVLLARRPPWASGIRRSVEGALAGALARSLERALRLRYPAPSTAAVAWAAEHAVDAPSVARLAAAVGQTPRGLANALRDAGLPSPARVLLWGRLLQAAALLGRDGATVEEAALRLGYSTAAALSRAMKRETGYTPGEVARAGGHPFVRACLFRGQAARSTRSRGSALAPRKPLVNSIPRSLVGNAGKVPHDPLAGPRP
ncbi:MAG: helix-turn-helix domain-containing protein [Longimicrobiales bacterium]